MGRASLVIEIIALVVGAFPFCGTWALVPAVIGLILGIVDLVIKSRSGGPKGTAIAGVILNPLAIIAVVIWWVLMFSQGEMYDPQGSWQQIPGQQVPGQQAPPFGFPPMQPGGFPSNQPAQPMQPMEPMEPMQPMEPLEPVQPQPQP